MSTSEAILGWIGVLLMAFVAGHQIFCAIRAKKELRDMKKRNDTGRD